MKKLITITLLLLCTAAFLPANVSAKDTHPKTVSEPDKNRAKELLNRLEEIRAMDLKSLPKTQKKELRRELRTVKEELTEIGGGIYISAGALIIILILIILL